MGEIKISARCAAKLPPLYHPLGMEEVENMDRVLCACVKVMWRDDTGIRVAFFDAETGEYITDCF